MNWRPWELQKMTSVMTELLKGKIGFPREFTCGAFTQDKLVYKEILSDYCVPFHKLHRTEDGELNEEQRESLIRFVKLYST